MSLGSARPDTLELHDAHSAIRFPGDHKQVLAPLAETNAHVEAALCMLGTLNREDRPEALK